MEHIAQIERPDLLIRALLKMGEQMFGQVPTTERLRTHRLRRAQRARSRCCMPYRMDIRHAVGVKAGVSAEKLADVLPYRESSRFKERGNGLRFSSASGSLGTILPVPAAASTPFVGT